MSKATKATKATVILPFSLEKAISGNQLITQQGYFVTLLKVETGKYPLLHVKIDEKDFLTKEITEHFVTCNIQGNNKHPEFEYADNWKLFILGDKKEFPDMTKEELMNVLQFCNNEKDRKNAAKEAIRRLKIKSENK